MKEILIFAGGVAVGAVLAAISRKPLIYRLCKLSSKIRNL
jgi:hypothetical protein